MSRRTRILVIAAVWAVAAVLAALPSVWPAWQHVTSGRVVQGYELVAAGVGTGWLTRDVLGRHPLRTLRAVVRRRRRGEVAEPVVWIAGPRWDDPPSSVL